MSPRDFNYQCTLLTSSEKRISDILAKKECSKEVICDTHTSISNLKEISRKLQKILSQSKEITSDWKKNKKLHTCFTAFS